MESGSQVSPRPGRFAKRLGVSKITYFTTILIALLFSTQLFACATDGGTGRSGEARAVDLDNDGSLEIIFGDYAGLVHVLSSSGEPIESDIFPYDTGNQIWGSPAAADIDLDGVLDFAITSKDRSLYVFDQNGLKFSYPTSDFLISTPSIGNIDEDD